jgi:hypothetical protein
MNELCQHKHHPVVCRHTSQPDHLPLQLTTAQAKKPYTQCCLQPGEPFTSNKQKKSQGAIFSVLHLTCDSKKARPGHSSSITTHSQIRHWGVKGDATIMLTQPALRLLLTLLINRCHWRVSWRTTEGTPVKLGSLRIQTATEQPGVRR